MCELVMRMRPGWSLTRAAAKLMLSPWTLGNMRQNGVRSLSITCGALWFHHEAIWT